MRRVETMGVPAALAFAAFLAVILVGVILLLFWLPVRSSDDEAVTLRYVDFRVYDPVYVGIEQGFFEDEGITVELMGDSLGGPTAIQAVSSGSADAGLSSIMALINARAAGMPVTGVTDLQSAFEHAPLEQFYVSPDSGIDSIDDLIGKKLAVNLYYSSFHYTLIMALENAGYSEDDVEWVLLPFPQQAEALRSGQVDLIGLMEPHITLAEDQYADDIELLFDAIDVFGEKQFTLHFVNSVWAEENPEATEAFVAGIVRAAAWVEDNQDAARPIISEYTGVPEESVSDYFFQPDARVVEEDCEFWLDYLYQRGDVEADWVMPDDVCTNAYNREVQ